MFDELEAKKLTTSCLLCDHIFEDNEESYMIFDENILKAYNIDCSISSILSSVLGSEIEATSTHSIFICDGCKMLTLEYASLEERLIEIRNDIITSYQRTMLLHKTSQNAVNFEDEIDALRILPSEENIENASEKATENVILPEISMKVEEDNELIMEKNDIETKNVYSNDTPDIICTSVTKILTCNTPKVLVNENNSQILIKCHICCKTFSTKDDLTKHVKSRVFVGPCLKCNGCNKGFWKRQLYYQHIKDTPQCIKSFVCSFCNKEVQKKYFSRQQKHPNKKFCTKCYKKFKKENSNLDELPLGPINYPLPWNDLSNSSGEQNTSNTSNTTSLMIKEILSPSNVLISSEVGISLISLDKKDKEPNIIDIVDESDESIEKKPSISNVNNKIANEQTSNAENNQKLLYKCLECRSLFFDKIVLLQHMECKDHSDYELVNAK